jgi:hypothetical protein
MSSLRSTACLLELLAGIDVACDGELSGIGLFFDVKDRLGRGFAGASV